MQNVGSPLFAIDFDNKKILEGYYEYTINFKLPKQFKQK